MSICTGSPLSPRVLRRQVQPTSDGKYSEKVTLLLRCTMLVGLGRLDGCICTKNVQVKKKSLCTKQYSLNIYTAFALLGIRNPELL